MVYYVYLKYLAKINTEGKIKKTKRKIDMGLTCPFLKDKKELFPTISRRGGRSRPQQWWRDRKG